MCGGAWSEAIRAKVKRHACIWSLHSCFPFRFHSEFSSDNNNNDMGFSFFYLFVWEVVFVFVCTMRDGIARHHKKQETSKYSRRRRHLWVIARCLRLWVGRRIHVRAGTLLSNTGSRSVWLCLCDVLWRCFFFSLAMLEAVLTVTLEACWFSTQMFSNIV